MTRLVWYKRLYNVTLATLNGLWLFWSSGLKCIYHRKWYRHSLLLSVTKLLKFISLLHRSIWNQLLLKQNRNKNALSLNVSFNFRSFIGNQTYWKETEKWNTGHFWMSACVEKKSKQKSPRQIFTFVWNRQQFDEVLEVNRPRPA